tara:strand:- start:117 stop:395 length:279 start_codon:yes stop_codon:yes gene_type:complete
VSDTINNIKLVAGEPADIYALSSITVGTQIIVQNIGACDVSLLTQAITPTRTDFNDANQILPRGEYAANDFGDSGAWAYCNNAGGLINVRVF